MDPPAWRPRSSSRYWPTTTTALAAAAGTNTEPRGVALTIPAHPVADPAHGGDEEAGLRGSSCRACGVDARWRRRCCRCPQLSHRLDQLPASQHLAGRADSEDVEFRSGAKSLPSVTSRARRRPAARRQARRVRTGIVIAGGAARTRHRVDRRTCRFARTSERFGDVVVGADDNPTTVSTSVSGGEHHQVLGVREHP